MANVTRWAPFDDVDELFRGLFLRPVRLETGSEQPVRINMDVKEDDKAYTVHAEIPGVKKEDISVSIDGSQVSVSAEVKSQKEDKQGERVLRSERYYGKVSRSFRLGQEVDQSKANAKYTDGVLELVLPKKAAASAKRLAIQ